jgi:hypothetical protein
LKRALWFAAIYTASLAALGAVTLLLRAVLHP